MTLDERLANMRREARKRRRKEFVENILVGLMVVVSLVGAIFGFAILFAILGAISISIGWNIGVYGLAHAVHTSVLHISFWTAFGTSFAIGALARIFRVNGQIEARKKS